MKLTVALGAAVLLGTTFAAQADTPEDPAPYGKRVAAIDEVAKSRAGSFDVYIDEPTGFAFVNTPSGWKFTRNVRGGSPAADGARAAIAQF